MARIVLFDATPLMLASLARGKPQADDCRDSIDALGASDTVVPIPEISEGDAHAMILQRRSVAPGP